MNAECIQKAKTELIANGHELALKAHTLLVIAERYWVEAFEYLDEDDAGNVTTDSGKAFASLVFTAKERAGIALEYVAAEMVTAFEKAGISTDQVPLSTRCQEVYEVIEAANRKGQAITGPEIIEEMNTKAGEAGEDRPPLEQGTLTSNIIPPLKALRGVFNKRGAGYYISGIYDPTPKE